MNEQQIAELNSQLVAAHQHTSDVKARLDRIDAVILDDSFGKTTGPTVSDNLNNPVITALRTKYLDFVNREANYSRKFGPNHLAVIDLGAPMLQSAEIIIIINAPLQLSPISGKHNFKRTTVEVN